MIEKELFGNLVDGTAVILYRIINSFGEYVELLDYGASIHSVCVFNKNGELGDVVLGARCAQDLADFTLEGYTVGRCANRIANASFEVEGRKIQLEAGRGGHCLHSGSGNYAHKHFTAEADSSDNKVVFMYHDKGEGGFGCTAEVQIIFSFDDTHCLSIEYIIIPDGTTVISPTNHAFFNLGCEDSRDHVLQIDADYYAVKSENGIPEGKVAAVEGTPLDFITPQIIRNNLERGNEVFFAGQSRAFDDNLILRGDGFRKVAMLYSPQSGRTMQVYTDMPSMVLFTFGAERCINGKGMDVYSGFRSVCLETQYVTNAVNCNNFESPVFHKGEIMKSKTIYQFTSN